MLRFLTLVGFALLLAVLLAGTVSVAEAGPRKSSACKTRSR